jgi:dienelactone hydrolase
MKIFSILIISSMTLSIVACDSNEPTGQNQYTGGGGSSGSGVPVLMTGGVGGQQEPIGGGTAAIGGGAAAIGGGTAAVGGGTAAIGGGTAAVGGGTAAVGGGIVPVDGGGAAVGGSVGDSGAVDTGVITGNEAVGCDGTPLLAVPDDTTVRGPWPVGHLSTQFGTFSNVDVLYPGVPGSEVGAEEVIFDIRTLLPPEEFAKVPESDTKYVSVQTYRALPIDADHGPYPVVVMVHGTASFSMASATPASHWASRGFIVVAATHPRLCFTDHITECALLPIVSETLSAEVDAEINAVANPTGDMAFLTGHADMTRVALAGHSAGAYNVAQFTNKPGVQVVILLSGNMNVTPSSSLKSSLYISGLSDAVLPFYPGGAGLGIVYFPGIPMDGSQSGAYAASPPRKRIVGITGGGHLTVTDLCQTNDAGQNAVEVMEMRGVGCLGIIPLLFDCGPVGGAVDWKVGIDIVADVTAAVLEETLHCKPQRTAVLSNVESRYPQIGHFEEEL